MMTNETSGETRAYTGIAVLILFGLAVASNQLGPQIGNAKTVRPVVEDPVYFSTPRLAREAVVRFPEFTVPEIKVIDDKNSEWCL